MSVEATVAMVVAAMHGSWDRDRPIDDSARGPGVVCVKCGARKHPSAFQVYDNGRLNAWCKACRDAAWRAKGGKRR